MNKYIKYNFLKKNIYYTEYDKNFLTPKRLTLLIISGLFFIGFSVGSFILLKIDLVQMFSSIGTNLQKNPMLIMFMILSILCPFFKMMYTIIYIRPAMKQAGIHVSNLEYIILAFKVFFFNTITPFASGGEPYVIYWIKSRGASIRLATSLSLVTMIVGNIAQLVLTLPSFIIITLDYASIVNLTQGLYIYWLVVTGLLINIVVLLIWIVMGLSKKFHYYCSMFSNWVLKKLKKSYLSKQEMFDKYIVQAEFQSMFMTEMKKWKRNLLIIFYIFLSDTFLYIVVFFSFCMISNSFEINNHTFWTMFNITNVSLTANNFIPIPSGEGTIQLTIGTMAELYFPDINNDIYNSIGFWKIITNYLPLIFCIVMMGWYYFFKIILIQKFSGKKKNLTEEVIKKDLTDKAFKQSKTKAKK